MSVSTEFLVTALVVALVPGTGAIYTVSTGLFVGRRASFFAALGGTLGIVPHLAAAILGLSALVHTGAEVFRILKFAGVAYLLYLAWGMWRSATADPDVITVRGMNACSSAASMPSSTKWNDVPPCIVMDGRGWWVSTGVTYAGSVANASVGTPRQAAASPTPFCQCDPPVPAKYRW